MYVGIFVVSIAVLLKASDVFIDSAEKIGLSLGISPFIIGVTIIAFGTSLPELVTSIAAVLNGQPEIVIGNVVGSNITNIALVLGLVAISIKTIKLEYNIWHIDMPYLWGSAFLLWFAVRDGDFTYFEAVLFIGAIIIFLAYSFSSDDAEKEEDKPKVVPLTYIFLVAAGVFVWLSADYTIYAISGLSEIAGIDKDVIALSAVALGTSLPEIIVSISAAKKGKSSMAVGNVLGSNIFNTYLVMAIPRFFGELEISTNILYFGLPFMVAMTILFGVASNNKKITRFEGSLLILFYIFYMGELFKPYF